MPAEPLDKTALGQVISHKPTDLTGSGGTPVTPAKTAVGNVVSHVPTGIKGPTSQGAKAPVQAKVVPHSSAITDSRSDGSVFAKIPLAFWGLSVVLLVFISATGVAIGVVLYLISARSVPLNNPQVVANRTYKNSSPSIEKPNGKTMAVPFLGVITEELDTNGLCESLHLLHGSPHDLASNVYVQTETLPERFRFLDAIAAFPNHARFVI